MVKTIRNWILGLMLLASPALHAQDVPKDWHLRAPEEGFAGMSVEKAYKELLADKKGEPVIVAIIDSGVEVDHEDLKDVMWVNEDEVPGNGIDDDGNGYVDDIHGWNFIGGKDGDVAADQLEGTRLLVYYKKKFANVSDPSKLKKKERKEYELMQKLEKEIMEKRQELEQNVMIYGGVLDALKRFVEAIGKDPADITQEDVDNFETDDQDFLRIKAILGNVFAQGATVAELLDQLEEAYKYFESQYKYHYNPEFDPRSIVGDNYFDSSERYYGNNHYEGPDADHGTHVAGIVGANRHNDLGILGVADNVRIMTIRAVPDGDERDKDVANAIRYAVDNGASVINMSFGKGYSWDKAAVDEAVKYAQKHDVLLVHAAGNNGQDNDNPDNGHYPTPVYEKKGLFGPKRAKAWIEVGASGPIADESLPASFSNYGKESVDVFAPGVDIYSTTINNGYVAHSGTSMASPNVAGVAALIRSYYPELTAEQVKEAILNSVDKVSFMVTRPGSEETVPMTELCRTGGIVNAYKALQYASKMKDKKKRKRKGA